jgi:hypothetical protein
MTAAKNPLCAAGAALSAEDVAGLERALEDTPGDLDARARLVGYYHARGAEEAAAAPLGQIVTTRGGQLPSSMSREKHVLWLAEHAPRAPLAVHGAAHLGRQQGAYYEAAAIWRRHGESNPPDATLLAHAIAFFRFDNDAATDALLARAEAAFPNDRRWIAVRRDRRALELASFYRYPDAPAFVLAAAHGGENAADGLPGDEQVLAEMEALLRDMEPDSECAPMLREAAAQLSLHLDDLDRARRHAELSLATEPGPDIRRAGDACLIGHLVLGRVTLKSGDVERAKVHLVLAGRAGSHGLARVFGPPMRLARDLLFRGEFETVLRYLQSCRAFWKSGPLDDWIARVRAREIPVFGRNLLS